MADAPLLLTPAMRIDPPDAPLEAADVRTWFTERDVVLEDGPVEPVENEWVGYVRAGPFVGKMSEAELESVLAADDRQWLLARIPTPTLVRQTRCLADSHEARWGKTFIGDSLRALCDRLEAQ